ncbi:MAG: pilus assembly protein PilM [Aquificaceae bacterium]
MFKRTSSPKSVVGVHITDSRVRIVEIDKDKKVLKEPVEKEITPQTKSDILREIVIGSGLSGKDTVGCLGVNDALLKVKRYPPTLSKKDLQDAIQNWVKIELSTTKEEMLYDVYLDNVPKSDGKLPAILVMTRKTTADELQNLLVSSGLRLQILDYEIVSIVNFCLEEKVPDPFAVLYVDETYALLVGYSAGNITHYFFHFNMQEHIINDDIELLESFFAEVRNIATLNDIRSFYLAGPVIDYDSLLDSFMQNLSILGILEPEAVPQGFRGKMFIPYSLCLRGLEK